MKGRGYVAPRAVRFVDLIRIIMRRFNEDRCMQIAASLTFTSLLAIVPVVTIAVTVISAFPIFAGVTAALHSFILQNLVPASVESIASYTQQFSMNAAKLTAVGIGFLAITAIMLLLTIERAFNHIWRVRRSRSVVQRIFIYWTLITVGPISIGASLTLTSWFVGQAIGVVERLPGAGVLVWNVVPIALTSLALTLLYMAMPNRRVAPRDAIIGGVLAGLVFEAMKRGFGFYVASFPAYTLVYGAFATLPVFLLWIYLSWLVVVFGAVVVAALPEWRLAAGQRTPAPGSDFFDALQILKILWRAHHAGTRVKLAALLNAATVRIDNVERILDTMALAGWVRRTVPSGWVLHRDMETLTVEDVFGLFTFRIDGHHPGREADPALEKLVREMGTRLSESMRVSLATLFRSTEQQDYPVTSREQENAPATSS
ncbi:MAG: YihY family inner membrane protein [Pseudomonadota bacterium]